MSSDLEWEDLQGSVDFEAVIEELGLVITEEKKGERWAPCPLDTHPGPDTSGTNFSVNEEMPFKWNCFVCAEGGELPTLVARVHNFQSEEDDSAYQKALRWLLQYSDLSDDVDVAWQESVRMALERSERAPKRQRGVTLPSYSSSALQGLKTAPVSLLEKWQITDERTVELFGLKYDPERSRIGKEESYTGPAIVIPHEFCYSLVGYQERWIGDDVPKWIPKYTNSRDFPKADTLFNYDQAKEWAGKVDLAIIVVESVMTVIRLWQLGYVAVSTFGAQITGNQARMIRSFPYVILALDASDPNYRNAKGNLVMGAGKKATRKAMEEMSDYTYIEVLPPVPLEKGDLADLDDRGIVELVRHSKPFLTHNRV